jgi:asparagine synthase (glutamine-hydrolysing)
VRAYNASIADQPEIDEGPWAQRAARGLGVELRTVRMTGSDWRAGLVEVVRHNEYPLMHESSVPMSMIAALAHADGVKVLLSGEGADELFAGYGFLHRGAYVDFLRHNLRVRPLVSLGWRKLREEGVTATVGRARVALADAATSRRARRSGGGPPDLDGAGAAGLPSGSPDVVRYEHELRARAVAAYARHEPTRQLLEGGLLGDLSTYLPHLLNRQDKNTMQRSIETRVPFLDPDVVGLALNLPLEVRVQPRRKPILRELGARHLPPEIGERPKVGFGFDVVRYLTPAAWSEFLADGLQRDMWGVPAEEWRGAVAGLTGHAALCFWMGEIWARGMLDGRSRQTIEAELWT